MLLVFIATLLAAVSIRQDQTPLRSGCDPSDSVIATLAGGAAVTIRSGLADGGPTCYKVTVTANGEAVTGYLRANQLSDTTSLDRERQEASLATESIKVTTAQVENVQKRAIETTGGIPQLVAGAQLIRTNRPAEALAQLEPVARSMRDPGVLTLTGIAAWKSDDPRKALEYWRVALDIAPNPELARLYSQVEREMANDRSKERSYGSRVVLRFERENVSPEVAHEMAQALDQEFDRISNQLGCGWRERLTTIVQSREAYIQSTGAAEWSGGLYDGRIRIALLETTGVGPQTRRAFAHELVHACLTTLGTWPAWLHEGLAQRLSGDRLSSAIREQLSQLASAQALPRLEEIGANWSRMSAENASIAYALSLAAAEALFERYGDYGLRNVLSNPSIFAQVTADLNRSLRLGRATTGSVR